MLDINIIKVQFSNFLQRSESSHDPLTITIFPASFGMALIFTAFLLHTRQSHPGGYIKNSQCHGDVLNIKYAFRLLFLEKYFLCLFMIENGISHRPSL